MEKSFHPVRVSSMPWLGKCCLVQHVTCCCSCVRTSDPSHLVLSIFHVFFRSLESHKSSHCLADEYFRGSRLSWGMFTCIYGPLRRSIVWRAGNFIRLLWGSDRAIRFSTIVPDMLFSTQSDLACFCFCRSCVVNALRLFFPGYFDVPDFVQIAFPLISAAMVFFDTDVSRLR